MIYDANSMKRLAAYIGNAFLQEDSQRCFVLLSCNIVMVSLGHHTLQLYKKARNLLCPE